MSIRNALNAALAAAAMATAIAPAAAGQTAAPITPGTRLRISGTEFSFKKQPVELVAADSATLQLSYLAGEQRDTVEVDRASITSLEVSRGWHSRAAKGAEIGLTMGLVTGAVWALSARQCRDEFLCFTPTPPEMFLVTTTLGTGVGALIGLVTRSECWTPIDADSAGLSPAPVVGMSPDGRWTVGLRIGLAPIH